MNILNINSSISTQLITKTKLPKITVITTCYNHAPYIEETLQSVLNQQYPNLEYIVIDGGSNDGSTAIIERYRDKLSLFLIEPNTLQIEKLIKGFQFATGDILCMLNSDDLFELSTLKEVAEYFIANPQSRAVYGNYSWIDNQNNLIAYKKELAFNRFIFLYDINYIPQPSAFWRRDLYEEIGGLNPSLELAMDADLWIRFSDVTQFHHVNKFWSQYRIHPQQKSSNNRHKMSLEMKQIRERYIHNESQLSLCCKGAVAKGMRLAGKIITGCYP
jgi:glycosyltransferase involved in cell wall biosynthesis